MPDRIDTERLKIKKVFFSVLSKKGSTMPANPSIAVRKKRLATVNRIKGSNNLMSDFEKHNSFPFPFLENHHTTTNTSEGRSNKKVIYANKALLFNEIKRHIE